MKYQRERLYKRLKKADNGRLVVEYWAGAKDFLSSVPGIDWEKQGNKILIKENHTMKTFKELLTEEKIKDVKQWSEMSDKEKRKAYDVAIRSKSVKDTFEGFSKQMSKASFNVKSGKPVEI